MPISFGHSENYQGTLGIDFKLAHDWHLGFDGTEGRDHDREQQNKELNNGNLAGALASCNPATALNVFGGANSAAVVDNVFNSRFYAPGDTGEQVVGSQGRRAVVSYAGRRCTRGLRRPMAPR